MAQALEIAADRALFDGQIDGLVAIFHENERPLGGLAGLLDWRLHGLISRGLRAGIIVGRLGEIAYFPVTRNGVTRHVILAGAGNSSSPGKREGVPEETVDLLRKNIASLRIPRIAISRSDFGSLDDRFFTAFAKEMRAQSKEVSLWIAP